MKSGKEGKRERKDEGKAVDKEGKKEGERETQHAREEESECGKFVTPHPKKTIRKRVVGKTSRTEVGKTTKNAKTQKRQ
jgi:hypothetical protein